MKNVSEKKQIEKDLYDVALRILNREIELIVGIRKLNYLMHDAPGIYKDLSLDVKSIESQTDHIFVDENQMSQNFSAENLLELKSSEDFFKDKILDISKQIISKYEELN
jgi:hypothetical protein